VIARLEDGVKSITSAPNGDLYLFSRKNAPRGKILRLAAGETDLARAAVVVPESDAVIQGYETASLEIKTTIYATHDNLFVLDVIGGPSQIRNFDLNGHLKRIVPAEPVSALRGITLLSDEEILFHGTSYLRPGAWFRYDASSGKSTITKLAEKSPMNFDDCELVREMARSRDGTEIPLTIIRRKGTRLDGNNPTLLYGYGGYGIVLAPSFLSPKQRLWLDHGGVYAVANLRGGGEFGEEWHKAGNLTHKQNVFDDFIGCAEFLIEKHYTSPGRLAIEGGSNGGLLMGAVLTQRPDLFRAVVSHVGIYDMLRVELDPNGSFNVPEFGSVKNPEQFKALYAYSPYHRVKDGVRYPAVLFLTGENDHRVNPMNSRKMTARLQAATTSGHPILLRTSGNSGHGSGTALSEQVEQSADVLAFLLHQLAGSDAKN
jgi:prolyl oligopeptidase